ncbi:hypothetical protein AB0D62_25670 [Streptomyces massasporeus]|uniref:hypothetical protein n=1 Tax=Streptomyces massasporeus TaxID=67324 RepID=UPI0033EC44AC
MLAQIRDDDGVAALEGLFSLYDALEEAPALAVEAPRLVAAARPGQRPAEQLEKRLAELSALHGQVRHDRTVLERLAAAEGDLRERLAEQAELRERVEELRRLESLVNMLDELSGQQQAVSERLEVLRSRDTSAERTLFADCGALVRLSEDQLDVLGPQTREALRQAEESGERLAAEERRLAQVTSELDGVRQRLEAVSAELGERIPQLERYARADRELAEALSEWGRADGGDTSDGRGDRLAKDGTQGGSERWTQGRTEGGTQGETHDGTQGGTALERARREAADVERRLAEVDRVLREALDQRADRADPLNGRV